MKKLSLFFLALNILASSLAFSPVSTATAKSVTISTPYEFCKFFIERYVNLKENGSSCADYADVVGAPLSFEWGFGLREDEEVTLKDLNLTYTSIREPFVSWGGKLIIDGGTYTTEGSCMFVHWFRNSESDSQGFITIKSGDFIAKKLNLRYTQTPICSVSREEVDIEEYERVLKGFLAPNSYFSEFGTETEIKLSDAFITSRDNFAKDYEETEVIGMLNRTQFSVRERALGPEPSKEPEVGPEEPTEEESEEPISDEPEQAPNDYPKAPKAGAK